jgi:hypothetical protein
MKLTRLGWAELLGIAASITLLASLFMPWFLTQDGNPNSRISGVRSQRVTIDAFVAFDIFSWALLAVCIAPIILALIVMSGTTLNWDRGEVTAIIGMAAVVLILFNGLIGGKPDDAVEVTLGPGWYIALIASLGIFAGGVARMGEKGVTNKPPGV